MPADSPGTQDTAARRLANRRRAYKGLSFGTTLICLGVVLLFNTLGRLGWGVWFDLVRLWPLLLISIGLRSIFVPTRLHMLSLLGPLMVVSATMLTVSWYRDGVKGGFEDLERGRAVGVSCPGPLRSAAARLHLNATVSRVRLVTEPLPEAPDKAPGIAGTLRYLDEEPAWACSSEGDLWLGTEGRESGLTLVVPFGARHDLWDARLGSGSPVAVRGDLIASSTELDLRAFDLDMVDLDLAATTTRIRLGQPRRRVNVHLEGGAANVRIGLPAGTCFVLSRDRALNVLKGDALPPRKRRARRLVSTACPPGEMGTDTSRYEINLELPFSTVNVETDGGA
ncbi:MAG: hypothetical protein ACREAA_14460 [Candidatus Polarisedimenticolia bacterium]